MTHELESQKCNGWTNHSTWKVAVRLDNEEPLYNRVQGLLKDFEGIHKPTETELRDLFFIEFGALGNHETNWSELAKHYLGGLL